MSRHDHTDNHDFHRMDTSLINTSGPNSIHPTGRQWIHLGNAKCDPGSGEVYRSESSGKVSDLAACQKSCQDDPWCKSITFFNNSNHCSHYSTECLVTKEFAYKNVISMRLKGNTTTALILNPKHPVHSTTVVKGLLDPPPSISIHTHTTATSISIHTRANHWAAVLAE